MSDKNNEIVLSIENLKKYYGISRGVEKVDIQVRKGEIFGFLGPNGAGKSTTIRTVLDYIRPTSGSITVKGMDPQKYGAKVRRSVGYLPSDFGTYKTLSARKYLLTLLDMMGYRPENRIEELANIFQLDLDRRIKDFSRGNRQKVGLISAFMHNPDLVILDEPTSGLDPLMQQEFYKLVLGDKKIGRTVFLSSHILTEVEAICDRVGIIREGEMVVTERMSTFKKKTGKVMTVRFKNEVDGDLFEKIKGVSEIHSLEGLENTLEMTVSRNIGEVIRVLAGFNIEELDYREASLEHIFLHFYGLEEVRKINGMNEEGKVVS